MNRRDFLLGVLGSTAAAMTLDLDRLLWVPGARTIFLPPDPVIVVGWQTRDWITREALRLLHQQTPEVYVRPWREAPRLNDRLRAQYLAPRMRELARSGGWQ